MRSLLMVAVLCGFASLAWSAPTEDELRKTEKAWAAAVLGGDFSYLERILTNGLIYAHSSGVVDTKSSYLAKLRSGRQKYTAIRHETVAVRLYPDAAVTHSTIRMTGTNPNGPFDDHLIMLHLWVRQDGLWRLAAHQTTKLE